jgi:hypothetical protein
MLFRITALKAPWPAGAQVGDIIDLGSVPEWAAGKCAAAPDAGAATVAFPSSDKAQAAPAAEAPAAEPAKPRRAGSKA